VYDAPVREGGNMRLLFLVPAAVLALSGCATAIRGNTQRIAIATDPPGARCELRNARGEASVVVDPTPAVTEVRRDNSDLEVRCEMPQRLLMVERFASSWSSLGRNEDTPDQRRQFAGSAVTLGVLTGATAIATVGIASAGALAAVTAGAVVAPLALLLLIALPVGVAVDHGTGAAYVYPSGIAILMPPAEFSDEAARAEYFDPLEAARRDAHALRRKEREASCTSGCERDQAADDAELARQLELLESIRARTRIAGSSPEGAVPQALPAATGPPG
jgi:hypothetical protein